VSSRSALALFVLALGLGAAWLFLRAPNTPEKPVPVPAADASGPEKSPAARRAGDEDDPSTSVTVVGRVVGAKDGAGIEGAVVVLRRHDDDDDRDLERDAIVRSDAGGGFALDDVAPGRYALSATAPGHLPAVLRALEVGSSAPDPITLKLDAGGHRLHGTVEDITGGPIEGAMVRAVPVEGFAALRAHEGFATLTADDGGYALQVAAGRYRVEVSHPDYASRSHSVEIGSGDLRQDFQLVPTAVIEGVVVDASTRAPIGGARVSWSRERFMTGPDGTRRPVRAEGGAVVADADGRFTIRGIQPGLVTLSGRAKQRASAEPLVLPVAIAEHVDGVELSLVSAFDVGGRVVSAKEPDKGVAGASVQIGSRGDLERGAIADAEGRFVVEGVLPGHYTMTANASGYGVMFPGVEVDVDADRDDVELSLDPGLRVSGRVDPPELAQVSLELDPENVQMGQGMFILAGGASEQTGEDGTFELGPVQPGRVKVVARAADGRTGEVDVDVGPEGADDVVVKLEPRVTVSGTLTGADGAPVAQALVSLRPERTDGKRMRLTINGRDMGVDSSVTADDGSFSISGLRAGAYEVEIVDRYGDALELRRGPVEHTGGRPVLAVPERDRDGVDLVVDAHTGEISGVVRTAEGDPAPDVWVTLARRPDLEAPRRVGEDGEGEPREEESHHEMRMVMNGDGALGLRERPPVLTGEDGTFRFGGLREGTYDLIAESGGGSARVMESARTGDRVTLKLAALGGVEGEVTLNGEAAKDFVVTVSGPSSRSVHVRDSGGHFRVDRLDPGEYRLDVHAGTGSGEAKFTVASGEVAERDVVLEELAKIVGTITDDAGAAIEGAMILVGEGARESGRIQIQQDGSEGLVTTDAEGKFETRCPAGPRVMVAIKPGEPRPVVLEFFDAKAGETTDLGTLTPAKNGPPERGPGGPREVEQEDTKVE
jgi:hypothetical protein